jgi:dTDP-4-amino-4,6-dideoxygalactose transaminase
LDEWNQLRKLIAARYREELVGVAELSLPFVPEAVDPSWHLFVIRYQRRDSLQKHLTQAGIGTLIHYPVPPHLSQAYADMGGKTGDFPITERLADTVLSIPMGPHLTADQMDSIINAILSFSG